uniref:Uncharacterized protein n=1 Tax=Cacopsylla melanoneura TaxID=428564 RepID=A0A8D8S9W0_9HEMI
MYLHFLHTYLFLCIPTYLSLVVCISTFPTYYVSILVYSYITILACIPTFPILVCIPTYLAPLPIFPTYLAPLPIFVSTKLKYNLVLTPRVAPLPIFVCTSIPTYLSLYVFLI